MSVSESILPPKKTKPLANTLPASLPIARYRFSFKVLEPVILPAYSGSTLRGIFGHALKKLGCITGAKKREDCFPYCPYHEIFEPQPPKDFPFSQMQNIPAGYIIEPPPLNKDRKNKEYKIGKTLQFNVVLLGKLTKRLPFIYHALSRALLQNLKKGSAELIAVHVEDGHQFLPILDEWEILPHTQRVTLPFPLLTPQLNHQSSEPLISSSLLSTNITLTFTTPLRIQHNKKILSEKEFSLSFFLWQLLRRFSLLNAVYFNGKNFFPYRSEEALQKELKTYQCTDKKELHWFHWQRYSNRQQRKMPFDGLMGTWHIKNLPPELAKLLWYGQYLHAGKNTTFGLGRFSLSIK